ncbi:VacJ family lipoprotein [Desulfoprunum benzoelyticum]|uniref:Phospholipid-binding lipoprotein MlaA n=1 Tax=Desulfoprunum benzoelyticum TaxID=1506996 RepID=A0A840V581_9BACT|nr:VacJ family lipoprotein [Desulfoprunum benzoelyticum]MBB5348899.1 phospholipid-binding lipoprotein MlaA [Desulfoprunum benzoelyticum]MBM9530135.1 VacJ family lipoprotein [Desulfoprunum benzoelyticum]
MKIRTCSAIPVLLCLWLFLLGSSLIAPVAAVAADAMPDLLLEDEYDNDYDDWQDADIISDPLEPWNRAVFVFNDKLYFWMLKPVKNVYAEALPHDIRGCIDNFVNNLSSPIVLINTLLQGRFSDAWTVISRFGINTVLGVYGFGDPAASEFAMHPPSADFGQTLGRYGAGTGIYLYWPIFGPSNVRDTLGRVADFAANPVNYVGLNSDEALGYSGTALVNRMSVSPDVYEETIKYSLDPYVAIRQGYYEYRNARIRGGGTEENQ